MSTVDDLLVQHRRGELGDADERRLQIAVQTSPEHELSLLAGAAFDRDGAPQPGDAALVRKIVRQVEGEWSGTFQRSRADLVARRQLSRWVALPLLLAGSAAASFGAYQAVHAFHEPSAASAPAASPTLTAPSEPVVALVPLPDPTPLTALPEPGPPELVTEPSPLPAPPVAAPEPAPAALPRAVSTPKPRTVPSAAVSSAAVSSAAVSSAAVSSAAVSSAAVSSPATEPPVAPEAPADESARALFRRANRVRQSDWEAAASLYEKLTLRFADSHEAGVAEMALGKHALGEGRASEALSWFRAYQRRVGGELTAEARWGEARALENLGETAQAQLLWRRLIEQYPASAYAAAARVQLGPEQKGK